MKHIMHLSVTFIYIHRGHIYFLLCRLSYEIKKSWTKNKINEKIRPYLMAKLLRAMPSLLSFFILRVLPWLLGF